MDPAADTYLTFPSLAEAFPPLVRKQRRLEAAVAAAPIDEEQQLRKEIDAVVFHDSADVFQACP
jgi:hypothetical protein